MTENIANIQTNFEQLGEKGDTVILLHGWGQNVEMMHFIAEGLKETNLIYSIDLPGFGKTQEPPVPWGVEDYCNWLREFCNQKKIENPILIGHSFGCRIALRYAAKWPVRKMILTGAAGLKPKRGLDYYAKVYTYKLKKKILSFKPLQKYRENLEKSSGSEDYKNSSGVMRQTLVKVVNDDVSPVLDKISCPVLLIFGEKDQATPLYMAKKLEKNLPDAGLVIFENDDHYAYFHQQQRFMLITKTFLEN